MKNRLEESNVAYTEIKEKRGEYEGIILELTEKKDSFIDEYNEFIEEFSDFRQLADRAQNNVKKIFGYIFSIISLICCILISYMF